MKTKKYIIILLLINIIGFIVFFSIHYNFLNKTNEINTNLHNLQLKRYIASDIDKSIFELQSLFMRLPITFTEKNIKIINENIKTKIKNIRQNLSILKNSNIDSQKTYLKNLKNISSNLSLLEQKLVKLNSLLKERNIILKSKDKNLSPFIFHIRRYIKTMPLIFNFMIENSNHIIDSIDAKWNILNSKLNDEMRFYNKLEFLIVLFGVFTILIIVYFVIKNLINLYKELENRLYYDHLTGLKNRIALEEDIENKTGTLFLIDIDSFNHINELYGVDIGNKVLIKLSKKLSKFLENRDEDLYRVSGDVFALYFNEIIDTKRFIIEMREHITNNHIFINSIDSVIELDIKIGVGIGDELLEKATIALDYAKNHNLQYYELDERILENKKDIEFSIEWQRKIKNGMKEDKFIPFYQPIVDKDKNIVKYESLMRLEIEENGEVKYISPFYLDVAIKSRQYQMISKCIIGKIFEKIANNDIEVTMNLNYLDIKNPDMNNFIFDLLEKYEGIGKRITFEILENENIENYELVKEFIKKFRSYGVKLAIDDFGSGYSNFKRVLEFEPDFVKIDATLIKNIDKDKASYIIVKSIVNYAKELNIKTIAEYIHSKEVFEICKSLGIDYFQGFYISKPLKDV
jgi:diguanylate cyclase (GGDEF)-like protein